MVVYGTIMIVAAIYYISSYNIYIMVIFNLNYDICASNYISIEIYATLTLIKHLK